MARPITTAGKTLQESDPRRFYSDDEVYSVLTWVAIDGSPKRAAEEFSKQFDRPLNEATIRRWRDVSYAGLYQEIYREHIPAIREAIAQRHESVVRLALDRQIGVLELLDPAKVAHSELAKVARDLGTVGGISTDKASALRLMPTVIVAHMDAEENLEAIARLVPGAVVDSTAVEEPVTDAEEVP